MEKSKDPLQRGKRKMFVGMVVSDRMQKTSVVQVEYIMAHAKYGKTMNRRVKFKVHDEKNEAHIGDKVRIEETRPLSKDKRWRLVEILSKASSVSEVADTMLVEIQKPVAATKVKRAHSQPPQVEGVSDKTETS